MKNRTRLKLSVIILAAAYGVNGCRRAPAVVAPPAPAVAAASQLDLNTATVAELERLPGVGPQTAVRIVAHRETYGAFRRVEHLLLVRGLSEARLRQMQPFVTVK
jgi:competence protein ComEA